MGAKSFSLQTRIISLVVIIVALVLLLSTYLDSKLSERTFEEDFRNQAVILAQELAASVGARRELEDAEVLGRELEEIRGIRRSLDSIEAVLFTLKGPKLIASTGRSSGRPFDPTAWSEVQEGTVVASLEKAQGQRWWDVTAPIRLNGEIAGAMKVRFSLEDADRLATTERRQSFIIMTVASVLIVGVLGWYLQRHVSRPIQTLVRTMARAEAGDLGVEAKIARHDELGRLAASFNRMLNRIKESYEENVKLLARIENFNRELQGEVERATVELAARHEELRQAHAMLFEVQRQLNRTERLAMVGQLAAMVAHDVSTPLSSISGHAQLLLQRGDLDGEAVERLKLIEAQIARVVEILHTLLTTSSAAEPVFKPVDVNQLVKGLLDLMSPVLSRKGVEAVTTLESDLPPVSGDTAQLQEVLLNGIVNALDAMPNGGSLRLTTRRAPSVRRTAVGDQPPWPVDPDDRSPGRDDDHVAIAVTDTGVGIPPEHLDHIFEPFFTTKEIGKGTGLGLSICRRIVKAHGGRIEVESQAGVGTTFGIILPALKG
jgi:signal transduction histidine kinase/HAMP domain-containing protein